MSTLNNTQLEILKLFRHEQSEEELQEIKQLLSKYLFEKGIEKADKEAEQKGYTTTQIESWAKEHYRTPSHAK